MKKLWQSIFLFLSIIAFPEDFYFGVDLSFLDEYLEKGYSYKIDGVEKNVWDIYRENHVNYVRFRVWNQPVKGYCSVDRTLKMAKIAKKNGLKLLIDLHYSDDWADPSKQYPPKEWSRLKFPALKKEIYRWTRLVVKEFEENETPIDIIQIGNEITNGFLWNYGKLNGNDGKQWKQFTELLKAAIRGVKEAGGGDLIPQILLHIDQGGRRSVSSWFFGKIEEYGVDFDLIGLSYYPFWHGTLKELERNLRYLGRTYQKDILILETAYPWTLKSFGGENNFVWEGTPLPEEFPATPAGQRKFLEALVKTVRNSEKGKGVFYWAPDYVYVKNFSTPNPYENLTLFDQNFNLLEGIRAFSDTVSE